MIKKIGASGVLSSSVDEISSTLKNIFSCEDIDQCASDKNVMTGHIPLGQEVTDPRYGTDHKELWHVCRFDDIEKQNESFYPKNIFPVSQPESETVLKQLFRSGDKLASLFLEALSEQHPQLADQLRSFHRGHNILRLLHYPVPPENRPFAIPPHRDSALFSILLVQKGGRFFYKDDSVWKSVDPKAEDQILIFPGLLLELISDGAIQAVEHYVEADQKSARHSAFYFVHPKPHQMLRYRDPKNYEKFIDISCADYLWKHAEELNLTYTRFDGMTVS